MRTMAASSPNEAVDAAPVPQEGVGHGDVASSGLLPRSLRLGSAKVVPLHSRKLPDGGDSSSPDVEAGSDTEAAKVTKVRALRVSRK